MPNQHTSVVNQMQVSGVISPVSLWHRRFTQSIYPGTYNSSTELLMASSQGSDFQIKGIMNPEFEKELRE